MEATQPVSPTAHVSSVLVLQFIVGLQMQEMFNKENKRIATKRRSTLYAAFAGFIWGFVLCRLIAPISSRVSSFGEIRVLIFVASTSQRTLRCCRTIRSQRAHNFQGLSSTPRWHRSARNAGKAVRNLLLACLAPLAMGYCYGARSMAGHHLTSVLCHAY